MQSDEVIPALHYLRVFANLNPAVATWGMSINNFLFRKIYGWTKEVRYNYMLDIVSFPYLEISLHFSLSR